MGKCFFFFCRATTGFLKGVTQLIQAMILMTFRIMKGQLGKFPIRLFFNDESRGVGGGREGTLDSTRVKLYCTFPFLQHRYSCCVREGMEAARHRVISRSCKAYQDIRLLLILKQLYLVFLLDYKGTQDS